MSMFWYFFPLTYYKFIDLTGLLPVTETDMAGSVILITILLSIGWFFSYFLNFKVTFPREDSAFLKSRDLLLILFPLCIFQVLLIVTGAWTYETTHNGDLGTLAMFAADVTLGIAPLVAYNFGLLSFRQRTVWQWLIFITFMSLEGVFFSNQGSADFYGGYCAFRNNFFHGSNKRQAFFPASFVHGYVGGTPWAWYRPSKQIVL